MPASLSSPLDLPCGARLPNRFAKSAMSEGLGAPDGSPSPALPTLYARLARGGAGLLITGNVMISPDGMGEPGNVVAQPGLPLAPFAAWASAAASGGALAVMQLNHAGRQAPRMLNPRPVAPSAVGLNKLALFATPRPLATEEVGRVARGFADAARLAERAGFGGVQLHAAHGYLLSQFLSPLTNLRTDAYGGSLDNRMRLLLDSYRAVRAATAPGFAVSVKLNSADFLRGGFSPDDAVVVARTLSEEGVDLLEVSGGTYERPEMAVSTARRSTAEREAHFLDYARQMRAVTACPLMLTGGVRTPALMERLLADGSIDVVGLARPLALEPDFPRQVLSGRSTPSLCRPAPRTFPLLAAATDNAWYQHQLQRMGRGLEPLPSLGTFAGLWHATRGFATARPVAPIASEPTGAGT